MPRKKSLRFVAGLTAAQLRSLVRYDGATATIDADGYVFELKVDRPPAIAMSQAERKDYAAPFVAVQKPIWLVGLSFERETRKFLAGVAERYGD